MAWTGSVAQHESGKCVTYGPRSRTVKLASIESPTSEVEDPQGDVGHPFHHSRAMNTCQVESRPLASGAVAEVVLQLVRQIALDGF